MPLAHILAPQLAQKARELEAELGPRPAGYLQTGNAGTGQTSGGPRVADTAWRQFRERDARASQRPDTIVRNAANRRTMQLQKQDKWTHFPVAPPRDTAPAPEPVAVDEAGRPIYAEQRVIDISAPGAVIDEMGRAVGPRGKKLGYLQQQDPNVRRDLGAAPSIGHLYKFGGAKGAAAIEERFAPHLQAMFYDPEKGDMRFPDGYFDGMSKKERAEILTGVDAMRRLERGRRI